MQVDVSSQVRHAHTPALIPWRASQGREKHEHEPRHLGAGDGGATPLGVGGGKEDVRGRERKESRKVGAHRQCFQISDRGVG